MNTYSATPSYLPVGSMAFSSTRPDSGLMHKRELRANVSQRAFITMERKVIIAPVSGIGDPQGSETYRLRGADTLTWGLQRTWALGKLLGRDAVTFVNYSMLADMTESDFSKHLQLYTATLNDIQQRLKADQLVAEIEAALARDCPKQARELATRGHEEHPDHPELARLARVLARPKVVAADLPPDRDLKANTDWLQQHRAQYSGQWVALQSGSLLAAAPDLSKLKQKVGRLDGLMVTRVI